MNFPDDLSAEGALTAEEFSTHLRSTGLRVTGPRLAVYRALADHGGHRSADDVCSAVAAAGQPLPRTSVYNALKALADAGLVDMVDAGPGTALYELHRDNHHHFLCRRCGTLSDVPDEEPLHPALDAKVPGAVVDSARVLLRGVCADCRHAGPA